MHNTRNITMILYGYFPSDTRVRKEINTLLEDKRNKITLLCLKEDSKFNSERVNVISLNPNIISSKREGVFALISFWYLVTIYMLKQNNVNIVHAHDLTGLPPVIIPKILGKVKKVIYDSHELFPEAANEELGWIYGKFFLILERICMFYVDLIVGISKEQKYLMQRRYNKPYILLPNYPSLEEIKPFYKLTGKKLESDSINIICHGIIRKNRNFITILDVLHILNERNEKFFLYIIGNGPDFIKIKNYAKKLTINNICFTGRLPFSETFQYLMSGDIAIALYDVKIYTALTCSNKLYECMAAGIPAIFSDLQGSREIMKETLIVRVNPNKPDQLLNALIELTNKKEYRKRASKISKQRFISKYNWENAVINLKEFYANA